MIVSVYQLQQITSLVILAAVIVAGVKCTNHGEADKRSAHSHEDGSMRIKAQSRISLLKGGGYGARVQIREDLLGRKHAHAMAICDCNGQGPWRPLFKPSQIIKTEFPEHESFHDEVDTQYRNLVGDDDVGDHQVDDHLQPLSLTTDHHHHHHHQQQQHHGSDSGVFGSNGGEIGSLQAKKHNHMIHLHLIPHIYVPVVHAATGYSEVKNYQAAVAEDGSSLSSGAPSQDSAENLSSEFHAGDIVAGSPQQPVNQGGESVVRPGDEEHTQPSAAVEDHGNFNGHSGESPYFTVSEDAHQHRTGFQNGQLSSEHFGNTVEDNIRHDYEAPSSSVSGEPHQYQVHEYDDLSKDYSNKKQVTSGSTTVSKQIYPADSSNHHNHQQQQQQQQSAQLVLQQKHKKAVVKSNRAKHGRMLTSRQDLKNLLVMRPPPMGQSQTWRYVYHHQPTTMGRHQFYQRKMPLMPLLKTRTVPLIVHIRQRSDD